MDRKCSALLTAVAAGLTFIQAAAPAAVLTPLYRAVEEGTLAELILDLELGNGAALYPFVPWAPGEPEPGETSPAPGSESPVPGETPGPRPSLRPTSTPDLTPLPTRAPTPTPGPTPEETATPEPTAEPTPEPTAEIRSFTDTPGVAVKNNTSFTPDIPALLAEGPALRLSAAGPQILIIHTHSTEAYRQVPGEEYESGDPYRTTDPEHSVIRVGDVLQQCLEAQGLRVIHDRGLYDYPSYTGSYTRSGEAVEAWLAEYPTIGVVIDLHRDAVGTNEVIYRTVAQVAGSSAAQVMLVVGTGENGLEHPRWEENLRLALALQSAMDAQSPTLTRPIHLAQERYNQHLTTGSLILEVGTNGNSLSEAIRAVELFGQAAGPVFLSLLED